jgi:hypothetical protein
MKIAEKSMFDLEKELKVLFAVHFKKFTHKYIIK